MKKGFSLVEILVSLFVGSLLLSAMLSAYLQNRSIYEIQRAQNDILQNSRSGLDLISQDVRTAGYGVVLDKHKIEDWVTWIPSIDSNPFVVQGSDGSSDEIYMIGAYRDPIAVMSSSSDAGDANIYINSLVEELPFDYDKHFLVYVGKLEFAAVKRFDNNTLTLSTKPSTIVGLKYAYEPGTQIELINTIHYKIQYDGQDPYLWREDSLETYDFEIMKMCANNIESLQINKTDNIFRIEIMSVSEGDYLRHRDPVQQDNRIRQILSSRVVSRNIQ